MKFKMPLNGFTSICAPDAPIIISKDKKNPPKHVGKNKNRSYVTHYKIDGEVIQTGVRCDFLLINEDAMKAYLIELKGSDMLKAAEQLEATEKRLRSQLAKYDINYRIVANKCKTQQIDSSQFKKYKIKWKGKLVYKVNLLEEFI